MKSRILPVLVATGSLAALGASDSARSLLSTSYLPHLYYYLAQHWLIWSNVAADSLIAVSFVVIFAALFWLASKLRRLPQMKEYLQVCASFGIFILACSATHAMETVTTWIPVYRVSIAIKAVCAMASAGTAILLVIQAPAIAEGIRRFFDLLDNEHRNAEALRKSEALLDQTNRVAGIGGWELNLDTSEVVWSAETARIHGLPPGHQPTLEETINFFEPECHQTIDAALQSALSGGVGYDLELPLIRADGRRIFVRLVGECEFLDGKPVRLFGSIQDKTAEIASREALRKSEDFLDRTNRLAGVGGWEVDIADRTVTWSEETYRIHGLPTSYKPSIETASLFYKPEARPIISAAIDHAIRTGEGWDLELQLIRADDKPIWVRTVGTVEFRDGRPYRLIGAIQDKTLQVAVRLAIESANQRITLATDNGGIGIWDWDIASNSFICDAWMFRLHGHEPSDETKPLAFWIEHLHPDDRPLVVQALQDAIEHGSPFDTEFRVIWSDGSVHHLKATGQVTRDEAGHPIRMVGTNRDVTEARCLAAELAQQNELLRVTLLSIGDGVVSKDIERKISLMNSAAERMTGWAAAEAVGRPVTEVFHLVHEETRLPADIHVDHNTPSSHRVDITKRILLISRDGTERSIESCATPIYDGRGNLLGSVLVFRDVTEQRRIARETEQITKLQLDLKLKDQFLSHVSHELRSPLTSVYSFTSIIADNLAGETTPQQQEYLQIVLKNVLQLQSMIEDLLTVTQSKEGKLPIDLQDTSAAPAIADAIDNARHAAAAKEIVLAACDASQMPQVCADPVRLRQILIILLDNAIKFTPAGGAISIRTVPQKDMLRFEVEDSGCGIPLEKRARVFEKLYQITGPDYADTSLAGRIGLGLGLHIARDLVRRQGGNIWVAGAPEQGSIFNFTLPLATGSRESAGGAGNPSHHGHSESTERSDLPFSSAA